MAKYTLSRSFSFEAAHRLLNYDGACKNLHGHSWHVTISISCSVLDNLGIAIDFNMLKELEKSIEKRFDHAMLVNANDLIMTEFCTANGFPFFAFKENPTCEVIAASIYEYCSNVLSSVYKGAKYEVESVEVKETDNSTCFFKQ